VRGVGGHGAVPHATKDPIVRGADIVGALQTLVSRELDPQDAAGVTVGSVQAGAKQNVISDEAVLLLTVRSYNDATRRHLLDGIARIARGKAIAAGVPDDRMPIVHVRETEHTPAVFNTPTMTNKVTGLFTRHFGEERIRQVPPPMVGEDFGRYHFEDRKIESLIFWVGGVPQAKWDETAGHHAKLPSLHSPFWAPDAEKVISTATEALTVAALDILKKG
jgi:hippurate hydrolase